jgi:metallophosphoesterase (TIGR00282 family)
MRILMIGDVVGSPGRRCVTRFVPLLRRDERLDAVVANAENAAAGRGVTLPLAEELFAAGVDVITLGDHVWDQKEWAGQSEREPRVLRAANWPPGCPGRGWITAATPAGPLTVISLLGRVFMPVTPDCPFRAADAVLKALPSSPGPILVDFHAEATSEKIAMGWHLDGRVAAVAGTHTHVPTADETVLPKGTAYITDLGMTGPKVSVLGRDRDSVLRRFITGLPAKFEVAAEGIVLEGAIVETRDGHRAASIRRLRVALEE